MSRWQEQLDNHPIWETIEGIKGHLSISDEDQPEALFAEKRRLSGMIESIDATLKQLDAETMPFEKLDEFNSLLHSSVLYYMQEFSEYGDYQHLHIANDGITGLLDKFSIFKSLGGHIEQDKVISGLNKLADGFASSLLQKQKGLEDGLEKIENELSNKEKQIEESLSSKHEELDALIADGQEKHEKILELYEIVAGDSASAGYAKQANIENSSAMLWRGVSIGFIFITAGWLFNLVLKIEFLVSMTLPWYFYISVLSLTGVLLYGSIYAAQQSAQHRSSEKKYRSLALRVTAFEPFVRSLEEGQKNELRRDIAATIFGDNEYEDADSEKLSAPIEMVTNAVVKILNAAKK